MRTRLNIDGRSLTVVEGDLATQDVHAVVNAANEQLQHGGGVARALAHAAGPALQDESDAWIGEHGEVGPGQAAVTGGGALPADHVVHVVGPRYREGQDNEGLLRQAVTVALDAARDAGAASVALPAISAGIFGYPPAEAASVIASTCAEWLRGAPGTVTEIRLVSYDAGAAALFADGLPG